MSRFQIDYSNLIIRRANIQDLNKVIKNAVIYSFEICPVCFWENDNIQFENPDYEGWANTVSLNQARRNYK